MSRQKTPPPETNPELLETILRKRLKRLFRRRPSLLAYWQGQPEQMREEIIEDLLQDCHNMRLKAAARFALKDVLSPVYN